MTHRLGGLMVAILAALSLCGCQGSDSAEDEGQPTPSVSSPSSDPDSPRAQVQEMLDVQAAALLAGDRQGFVEAVGQGPVRTQQLEAFDLLQALPLNEVTMSLGMSKDETATELRATVAVAVGLDGIDKEPVEVDHEMTFQRRGERWVISGDKLDPRLYAVVPWEAPGVRLDTRDHLYAFIDTQAAGAEGLVTELTAAVSHARSVVPDANSSSYVAVVSPRWEPVAGLGFNTPLEFAGFQAEANAVPGVSGFTADHRLVIDSRLASATPGVRGWVTRHVAMHAAMEIDPGVLPLWVSEGLAGYGGESDFGWTAALETQAAAPSTRYMPHDQLFLGATGRRADITAAYGISTFAFVALAEEQGDDAPWKLFVALDALVFPDANSIEQTTIDTTGHTPDELARQGAALIRRDYPNYA